MVDPIGEEFLTDRGGNWVELSNILTLGELYDKNYCDSARVLAVSQ